jgi:hypothetical protein
MDINKRINGGDHCNHRKSGERGNRTTTKLVVRLETKVHTLLQVPIAIIVMLVISPVKVTILMLVTECRL